MAGIDPGMAGAAEGPCSGDQRLCECSARSCMRSLGAGDVTVETAHVAAEAKQCARRRRLWQYWAGHTGSVHARHDYSNSLRYVGWLVGPFVHRTVRGSSVAIRFNSARAPYGTNRKAADPAADQESLNRGSSVLIV